MAFLLSLATPSAWAEEQESRQFNDVVRDLLDEFAYDLKTSQIPLGENLALRKVDLSENIPQTYEKYLETLISERVREFSSTKVVHCSTCRVKRSVVKNGRVKIVMPINNKRTLDRLAREYGVKAWLDAGLIYQSTSMILAFNLFDAKTKELIWSKVYNSETLYKRFPDGVPDPEIDRSEVVEKEEEKDRSNFNLGVAVGWSLVPNVNESSNMLAISLRFSEVFNKLRSEVGAQVVALVDTAAIVPDGKTAENVELAESGEVSSTATGNVVESFQYGVGLFGTYHHNFLVSEEAQDKIRPGFQTALGMVLASGYLAFTGKLGFNLRMGRSLVLEADALYSAPTTISLGEDFEFKTQGGVGALATFGFLF